VTFTFTFTTRFNIQTFIALPTKCLYTYVFRMDLRDYFPIQVFISLGCYAVSYRYFDTLIGPIFKGQAPCVTSQKSEGLIYFAAER